MIRLEDFYLKLDSADLDSQIFLRRKTNKKMKKLMSKQKQTENMKSDKK